ncbi:MAG: LPS-assembly protein LptD [bacterium]|nr:LPS-assembly protein LptD [bacterium]
MVRILITCCLLFGALVFGQSATAQTDGFLTIHHTDDFEIVFAEDRGADTIFARGNVIFETRSGMIYCDSAAWAMGSHVWLRGRVIIEDDEYRLAADDSVHYDLAKRRARAEGSYVELWSYADSIMAVGTRAFFDRNRDYFYMVDRPTIYLKYPDSAAMVEVIADVIEYDAPGERADASGDVRINSNDMNATAGCAVMRPGLNLLDLYQDPVVIRNQSEISGKLISILTGDHGLERVDVVDSAQGLFVEPTDSTDTDFDRSRLSGGRIVMDFEYGDLESVTCQGQAYSWYNPSPRGKKETVENTVSGDSIRLSIVDELLTRVDVVGGSIGTYFSTTESERDSVITVHTDTIDYSAHHITYNLADSLITLERDAATTSSLIQLTAYQIDLDTRARVIEAFSGEVVRDSIVSDNRFAEELQPNAVPVVLRDGEEILFGDYLKYSIDTEKGRIVTSKSKYETGFFYGENLYRQDRNVFYLEDGRYTTCDADEPHFHFHSKHLKLIEGDRLIARPVVMNIGRLPILALPYYVFPLKKGRHSGFLPFTLGNIEKGEYYIRNVGYYWAASDYWDWEAALDYFEDRNKLNVYNKITYNKLYTFDGYVSGNYGRETEYIYGGAGQGTENRETRWTLNASHNHTFSPSFKISATGSIQSDPKYYNDYSTDLDQRLNRVVRSKLTFSKKFGRSVSISGTLSHDDYLDEERRIDQLPSLSVSLPRWNPFGSGSYNDEGKLERRWYNELIVSYSPSLLNRSTRSTVMDSIVNIVEDTTVIVDTTIVVDTITAIADTTFAADTTVSLVSQDSVTSRTRREYTTANHRIGVSFPSKLFKYIVLSPSLNYYETWYKIYPTDQSDSAGIDVGTTYRSYYYNMGASVSTTIYGTVYPKVFGLMGLRQVIQPTITYTYTPKNDHHPDIRSFAGGGAASTSRSQRMTFRLSHVYQAKIQQALSERNLELMSITSSFSHDFEKDTRRFSSLTTTFNSNVLPKVRLNGSMSHSLYLKDTDDLDFWHPRLTNFTLSTSMDLAGRNFLFDDVTPSLPRGADSASQVGKSPRTGPTGGGGWSLSASYGYSETGIDTDFFRKKSFLSFNLRFNLTPSTRITYSQSYNFDDHKTVTNRVNIERTIHCWSGTFHWVPTGSTKGWGFNLHVTAIPAIKIDNSQNSLSSGYLQNVR